jgi:hypothetical protein
MIVLSKVRPYSATSPRLIRRFRSLLLDDRFAALLTERGFNVGPYHQSLG